MNFEYRSVSLKCECGKIHTYFGQDAQDVVQMLDACSTPFFRGRKDISTVGMLSPTFTCCDDKYKIINWCKYDVMEV